MCYYLNMDKKIKEDEFKDLFPKHSNSYLANYYSCAVQTIKNTANKLGLKKSRAYLSTINRKKEGVTNDILWVDNNDATTTEEEKMKKEDDKPTLEVRHDGKVVINWKSRTIVTELGEFGSVLTNFGTHSAIQRYYVDAYGEKHTAAETAMKFPIFPHPKAVYIYARLHGFSKASPPQTDLEFEEGLSEDDAVKENIQSMKARVARRTEIAKWREIQRKADKWDDFKHSVFLPMKDFVEENLPKWKPPKFKPKCASEQKAWVVGLADFHYLKWAYNHKGETTFDKKKAEKILTEANNCLITDGLMQGKPERIFIPMGNDNFTVDNIFNTTTAGTSQTGQTDGSWRLDLENYFRLCINMVELYAQIAPVTIVPMEGNHDRHTSITLNLFLKLLFENRDDVNVIDNHHPRVYTQYGKTAFMFTHGDTTTQPKLKREAHKFFMAEAKQQGIKTHQVTQNVMFSGHIHTDSYEDLGAIKHFIIPSLAPPDEWHVGKGYIGNKQEASLYIFDKKEGRKAVLYS